MLQKERAVMHILLTGGSGDMGSLLTRQLFEHGDNVSVLDVAAPHEAVAGECAYIEGSILDRDLLQKTCQGIDCVVHIAAWHGIHEHAESKDAYDFHDLNVTGTFQVFEAAARAGVKKFVLISSTSVDDCYGLYGHTKVLNEEMARAYAARHGMDILVLRPRAFIPPWNTSVYENFIEWAAWFWKGAVHVEDVCQASFKAIRYLEKHAPKEPAQVLTIDGAYDYSADVLRNWSDESFAAQYGKDSAKLAESFGLDTSRCPKIVGSKDAEELIGYKAKYSIKNLLDDLKLYTSTSPRFPLEALN